MQMNQSGEFHNQSLLNYGKDQISLSANKIKIHSLEMKNKLSNKQEMEIKKLNARNKDISKSVVFTVTRFNKVNFFGNN
jgi:hypothetical protein